MDSIRWFAVATNSEFWRATSRDEFRMKMSSEVTWTNATSMRLTHARTLLQTMGGIDEAATRNDEVNCDRAVIREA